MDIKIDYCYGNEANQYTFYRIPKILFKEPKFKNLSVDAKMLYSLMLDRMGLSIKNNWHDAEDNRVYIYFPLDDIKDYMNCGHAKGSKIVGELEDINLIERVKQGQGKPAKIYVKKFILEENNITSQQNQDLTRRKSSDNKISRLSKIDSQDFSKSTVKTSENQQSRLPKISSQDFSKSNPNNIKYNNNDFNNNDFNNTEYNASVSKSYSVSQTDDKDKDIDSYTQDNFVSASNIEINTESLKNRIKQQINYDLLILRDVAEKAEIEALILIMTEVLASNTPTIRVNGEDKLQSIVKSVFSKIDCNAVTYAIRKFKEQKHLIKRKKAYLMTCLYNAQIESIFCNINNYSSSTEDKKIEKSNLHKPKHTNSFCSYEQREWDFEALNKIKLKELEINLDKNIEKPKDSKPCAEFKTEKPENDIQETEEYEKTNNSYFIDPEQKAKVQKWIRKTKEENAARKTV